MIENTDGQVVWPTWFNVDSIFQQTTKGHLWGIKYGLRNITNNSEDFRLMVTNSIYNQGEEHQATALKNFSGSYIEALNNIWKYMPLSKSYEQWVYNFSF